MIAKREFLDYISLETDYFTEEDHTAGIYLSDSRNHDSVARLDEQQLTQLIKEAQEARFKIIWLQAEWGWVDGASKRRNGSRYLTATTRHLVPALRVPSAEHIGESITTWPGHVPTLCGLQSDESGWSVRAIRDLSIVDEGNELYPTCKICLKKYRKSAFMETRGWLTEDEQAILANIS